MYDCPDCMTFLVVCPCCQHSFCPDCGASEDEIEAKKEQEDGEDGES